MKTAAVLALFAFITLAVFLSGCIGPFAKAEDKNPTPTPDAGADSDKSQPEAEATDFDKIQEGWTEQQVIDLLGEPVEKQTVTTPKGSKVEYWYYESGKDIYRIAFDSTQTVTGWRKF